MYQVENVLVKIKDVIVAALQTRLTAIAAEKADGISLTAPISTAYYINEVWAIDQLPAVQVIPDTTDVQIPGTHYNEDDHYVIIIAHTGATEGDTDICAKRTYRFARAIREIILSKPTLDDTVVSFHAVNVDYKPMMADGNTLKQEVWIRTIVRTHET